MVLEPTTMPLFSKAIVIAAQAHEGQGRRGNGEPVFLHAIRCGMEMMELGAPDYAVAGMTDHDVVEETQRHPDPERRVTLEYLEAELGHDAAHLVKELTRGKKESQTAYVRSFAAKTTWACCGKLIDRKDNLNQAALTDQLKPSKLEETHLLLDIIKARPRTSKPGPEHRALARKWEECSNLVRQLEQAGWVRP